MTVDGPLRALSALINRHIARSETAQRDLTLLAGQAVTVEIEGLPLTIQLRAGEDELRVVPGAQVPPEATIAGTPLALLRLLAERQPDAQALARLGIRLDGDEHVAAGFARLLGRARPELEEELAALIGDVAAHQVGTAARSVLAFTERTLDTMWHNTGEFLQQESRVLPSRLEVRSFCADVDRLRDAVERAAARLKALEKRPDGADL